MASNVLTAKKTEATANCVQEMAINSQEPPANYCYKESVYGDSDISCLPLLEIPVIDVCALASPSTSNEELEKLHSALTTLGCFMSINHGMSISFMDKVRSVTKQFFALPMEEKQKCGRGVDRIDGYGSDAILSGDQILDWTDRLFLVLSPEEKRELKLWPDTPANFRETIIEYVTKLKQITEVVLKTMAMSLNLEERCFLDKCGEQATFTARFNFFPPCSRHNQVLGMKPHSDSSAIAIILQDKEVEGLQFLIDNQWLRVPIIPEALLINLGDQAEIMSNGLFKSPVHRVVVNPKKERFSLAVFYQPDAEKDIEPVDGLVTETRPRLYKRVKNYFQAFGEQYQQGKRLIQVMKIENF